MNNNVWQQIMYKILILLATISIGFAEERLETARDLRVSTFGEAGNLIRKLTALSASGPLVSPILEGVTVEFFGDDPDLGILAVLNFTNARYQRADETVTGDSSLQLTTDKWTIAGLGFNCDLAGGRLDLQASVKFKSAAIRMTGDRGEIDFETDGRKQKDMIRKIAVTGNIVLEREATTEAPFDRAECTFARFSAEEDKVFLKTPVTTWRNGERFVTDAKSGFLEINLSDKEPNKSVETTPISASR